LIVRMGAIRYSCRNRLFPAYILPAKEIGLLRKLQPDRLKT